MITSLSGKISHIGKNIVEITVNGFGCSVFVPERLINHMELNKEVFVYTYLQVREDAIKLYGFNSITDREFFKLLLGISGIGPKVSLGILDKYDSASIAAMILENDVKSLQKIPGIGNKTAMRIVLEIKEKVGMMAGSSKDKTVTHEPTELKNEVMTVLIELGLSRKEADVIIEKVSKTTKCTDFDSFLTDCLKSLGENKG